MLKEKRAVRIFLLVIAFVFAAGMVSITNNDVYAAAKTPAQVKSLKLSKSTTSSLAIKWGKAKSAKKYEVSYRVSGTEKYKSVKTSKRSYTIKKLKEGTTYQVKVRAINGKKTGKWSSTKKFKTVAKTPSQVKKLKVAGSTDKTLLVSWGKTSYARQYEVSYKLKSAKKYTTKKTSSTEYTIEGLKATTEYKVKVRAINGNKKGKWSSESTFKTAKRSVYADAVNETQVKVSVTADSIKISVEPLGISGQGEIYSVAANDYLAADPISGLVTEDAAGVNVGAIDLGAGGEISLPRVENDSDKLYDKYYIVQGGKIIKGPIYATNIAPKNSGAVEKAVPSKKGLVDESGDDVFAIADDLGSNWTAMNIDFTQLILASPSDNSEPIVVNGKTYYINKGYVDQLDYRLSKYEDLGINVVAVVISFVSTEAGHNYPRELKYIDNARWTNGFNTSNDVGRDNFIAGMEYLANRYSQGGNGLICNYVIGNEIDYAYDWNEIIPNNGSTETRADFDAYMEEYARALRIANLAVKKYSSDVSVSISLSKEWAKAVGANKDNSSKLYDSYAPKEMLDWLNFYTKKGGDYDWTICPHNYPVKSGNTAAYETGLTGSTVQISGNVDFTKRITQSNLEVLQMYLERSANLYNGAVREVYFTENGSSSHDEKALTAEAEEIQAATIAQYYYRAASLPCVKAIIYYKIQDRESEGSTALKMGLMTVDGRQKKSYELWKYIDTNRSFEVANPYLGRISFMKDGKEYSVAKGNIKSYRDLMSIVNSKFSWSDYWNEAAMTPVSVVAE